MARHAEEVDMHGTVHAQLLHELATSTAQELADEIMRCVSEGLCTLCRARLATLVGRAAPGDLLVLAIMDTASGLA